MSVGKVLLGSIVLIIILILGTSIVVKFYKRGTANDNKSNSASPSTNNRDLVYNVVVLLDLSDRIKNDGQVERDKQTVAMILDIFDEINKKYDSKDIFKVAIAPQSDFKIKCELPVINMTRLSRQTFLDKKNKALEMVDCIYSEALQNEKTRGADIYSFFKDHLDKYTEGSDEITKYENKVIILTDGYLLFDENSNRQPGTFMSNADLNKLRNNPNWRRDLRDHDVNINSDGINVENTDVLMMEVDPQDVATNETDILEAIWTDWFEHIGIQQPEFIAKEGKVDGARKQVSDFITEKKTLKKQ